MPADTQLVNLIGELGGLGPEAVERAPPRIAALSSQPARARVAPVGGRVYRSALAPLPLSSSTGL